MADKTPKHESQWTHIYWDVDPAVNKMRPYIRFAPVMMDLEAAGFSHGITLSGSPFYESEEQAIAIAKLFDKFFDAMKEAIIDDENEAMANWTPNSPG